MVDIDMALYLIRRLALARTTSEINAARDEAYDFLDQAGWTKSAAQVLEADTGFIDEPTVGIPIPPPNQELHYIDEAADITPEHMAAVHDILTTSFKPTSVDGFSAALKDVLKQQRERIHMLRHILQGQLLSFPYTNHRGMTEQRTVRFIGLDVGSNDYYPEPQWLLRGHDMDRQAVRSFALNKIDIDQLVLS